MSVANLWRVLLAGAALAAAALLATTALHRVDTDDPAASSPSRCRYAGWSPLRLVAELPPGERLDHVEAVAFGERLVIAGTLSSRGDNGQWWLRPRPLLVLDGNGRNLALPAGGYWFQSPHLAMDTQGSAHLLWGESGGAGSMSFTDHASFPVSALRHSSYHPDRGWLEAHTIWGETDRDRMLAPPPLNEYVLSSTTPIPMRVATTEFDGGKVLYWDERSSVVLSENGYVRVAAPQPGRTFLFREEEGGAWQTVVALSRTAFAELAGGSDDKLSMAYHFDRGLANPQEIRVLTSSDDGDSWYGPVIAARSADGKVGRIELLHAADGRLHLLWSERVAGDTPTLAIRHAYSGYDGLSWSNPATSVHPGNDWNWDAGVDLCGGVHLVYSMDGALSHALWSGDWSESAAIDDGEKRLSRLALTADVTTGELHLVGVSAEGTVAADSLPRFAVRRMSLPVQSARR